MEINAYVLALTVNGMARYLKEHKVVPEAEFKPFDFRYLRSLSVNYNPTYFLVSADTRASESTCRG
jgi:hypothetical protein